METILKPNEPIAILIIPIIVRLEGQKTIEQENALIEAHFQTAYLSTIEELNKKRRIKCPNPKFKKPPIALLKNVK